MNFRDRMIGNKLYGNISSGSNTKQKGEVVLAAAASGASSSSYRVSGEMADGRVVSNAPTGISTAVAEERMSDASHTAVASKVSRMPRC